MPTDLTAVLAARRQAASQQASEEPTFLLLWVLIALAHVMLALADPTFADALACLGRY